MLLLVVPPQLQPPQPDTKAGAVVLRALAAQWGGNKTVQGSAPAVRLHLKSTLKSNTSVFVHSARCHSNGINLHACGALQHRPLDVQDQAVLHPNDPFLCDIFGEAFVHCYLIQALLSVVSKLIHLRNNREESLNETKNRIPGSDPETAFLTRHFDQSESLVK